MLALWPREAVHHVRTDIRTSAAHRDNESRFDEFDFHVEALIAPVLLDFVLQTPSAVSATEVRFTHEKDSSHLASRYGNA